MQKKLLVILWADDEYMPVYIIENGIVIFHGDTTNNPNYKEIAEDIAKRNDYLITAINVRNEHTIESFGNIISLVDQGLYRTTFKDTKKKSLSQLAKEV